MKLTIHADGRKIPLNFFVRKSFTGAILGMLSALKGLGEPREIVLTLRHEPDTAGETAETEPDAGG